MRNSILKTLQPTSVQDPVFGKNQVQNNAGGFVFDIGKWKTLERFLILGTEGGTYYVSEKKLTLDNLTNLQSCIIEDPARVINTAVEISDAGRALKNEPAIFALVSVLKTSKNEDARKLAALNLNKVVRTGTHRATAASYINLSSKNVVSVSYLTNLVTLCYYNFISHTIKT